MKNKKLIGVVAICVIVICIICLGLGSKKDTEKQTSDEVDKALEQIKEGQSSERKDGTAEEKSEKHITISNELQSLLTDEQIEAVKKMVDTEESDEGLVLNTNYASERTKIKTYCKEQIDTYKKNLKAEDDFSCDLEYGTINFAFNDMNKDKDIITNIEGLVGLYQKVKYPDQNWCIIVYGGFEKYVSDESIASISDATPMQP